MDIRHYVRWIGFGLIVIIFFGTLGLTVLTAQRQQVNAPLLALSENAASQLNSGLPPTAVTQGVVNMNSSLMPFSIIYTKNGQPIAGSGMLSGSLPAIPIGVLAASRGKEYSSVTWQPQGSLRYATVTVSANDYYIVSGQSLHFAEHSSALTEEITGLGCVLSLAVIGVLFGICLPREKN